IQKGNLESIIDHLPNGLYTLLGKEYSKEGQDLSGGQWQRIILSRAYMGEPDLLILDEPTASIDPLEEMRLLGQFKNIVQGKTALLISHRIGFARMADRICIMENGHIVEDGTHDTLLQLKGNYYTLFMAQQELYK
ncbi:MAG: ABC transporter ATP-binding protein, partial [Niameybacter sp.]